MLKVGDRVRVRVPKKRRGESKLADALDGLLGVVLGPSPDPASCFVRFDNQASDERPFNVPDHWLEEAPSHPDPNLPEDWLDPCVVNDHEFIYALDDTGSPILVFCGECGRQWKTVPEGGSNDTSIYQSLRDVAPQYVVAPTRHMAIIEATKLGLTPQDVRITKESLRGISSGEIHVFRGKDLPDDVVNQLTYLANTGVTVRWVP